jgi:TRAP-type mannitol/chloroaromatic compound transport system permease large subunit
VNSDHTTPPDDEEPPEREELRTRDIVMRYFEDSALWPVLIVILAHIVALVGFIFLLAVRDRNFGAIGATGGLVYLSFVIMRWEWRETRRLRTLSITVVAIWILSGVAAYYGHKYHFL